MSEAEFAKKLDRAQEALQREKIDGWLLYDFRRSNPLACRFLDIPANDLLTRRFFYWIPSKGAPVKIVHEVENPLIHLPGKMSSFRSWQELEDMLRSLLKGSTKIAMEYSPKNAIPEISRVDGGTLDLIKSFKVEVVSSGDILQEFNVWDRFKMETHRMASKVLDQSVSQAWDFIAAKLRAHEKITEFDVQQFLLDLFEKHSCLSEYPPICAVNQNSANPHYCPRQKESAAIEIGDFILIDLWCKEKLPKSVYADITRVGVAKAQPTDRQEEIFTIVKEARDAAISFLHHRAMQKLPIFGFEVDDVCRGVIEASGYGEFFVHRTGHNIDEQDHGPGAHIDNLETHDTRKLVANSCFSIEPGIYLPGEFGVRLECNVILHEGGQVEATGGLQKEIKKLF